MREDCDQGLGSPWVEIGELDKAVERLFGCATAAQTSTCPRHAVPKSPPVSAVPVYVNVCPRSKDSETPRSLI